YDRESGKTTERRLLALSALQRRSNCQGRLTKKRALENYLYSSAIEEACGVTIEVDDAADIPERVAGALLAKDYGIPWHTLTYRAKRRGRTRTKQVLSANAASRMTLGRLRERDPDGELAEGLRAIGDMAS